MWIADVHRDLTTVTCETRGRCGSRHGGALCPGVKTGLESRGGGKRRQGNEQLLPTGARVCRLELQPSDDLTHGPSPAANSARAMETVSRTGRRKSFVACAQLLFGFVFFPGLSGLCLPDTSQKAIPKKFAHTLYLEVSTDSSLGRGPRLESVEISKCTSMEGGIFSVREPLLVPPNDPDNTMGARPCLSVIMNIIN